MQVRGIKMQKIIEIGVQNVANKETVFHYCHHVRGSSLVLASHLHCRASYTKANLIFLYMYSHKHSYIDKSKTFQISLSD